MHTKFVLVLFDVYCNWNKLMPKYRIFVNDELFTERTWIWDEHYLEEQLQIEAPPGHYKISVNLLHDNGTAQLKIKNPRIAQGDARIDKNLNLEIIT